MYVSNVTRWVPQSQCPSVTPTLRRRTAYLAALTKQVHNVIRDHLAQRPQAEDVTLVVLAKLAEPFRRMRTKVSPSRLNQDVGLFVAQCLVDVYGADRVQTLRGVDGRTAAPRRNARDDVAEVTSFTPHRVTPTAGHCDDRILLDTVVARKVLHGDIDAIDLGALGRAKGAHPVSLADGAFAELTRQIVEGRIPASLYATLFVGRRTSTPCSILKCPWHREASSYPRLPGFVHLPASISTGCGPTTARLGGTSVPGAPCAILRNRGFTTCPPASASRSARSIPATSRRCSARLASTGRSGWSAPGGS
jgi:hypothetical protein